MTRTRHIILSILCLPALRQHVCEKVYRSFLIANRMKQLNHAGARHSQAVHMFALPSAIDWCGALHVSTVADAADYCRGRTHSPVVKRHRKEQHSRSDRIAARNCH